MTFFILIFLTCDGKESHGLHECIPYAKRQRMREMQQKRKGKSTKKGARHTGRQVGNQIHLNPDHSCQSA